MNSKPITFISFCVDIDRGLLSSDNSIYRSFNLYERGMYENINTNLPLVLYSSVKNLIIPPNRDDSNFRHYFLDKELLEKEFPNFELYKNAYPTTHKDEIASSLFYYTPLVVLKMKKIMEVLEKNPFNSELFFWIDCFFIRGIIENNFLFNEKDYLMMFNNVKNKLNDKFVLLNFGSRPFGFFWGGNKKALENVYKHYFDIFFEYLPQKLMTEELIFKEIYNKNPDLMHFIQVEKPTDYKIICQNFLTK